MMGIPKPLILLLFTGLLLASIPPASAMFQAQIIPPAPYTVYPGQSYTLTVNVQYDIPQQAVSQIGPIKLAVSSPPAMTSQIVLQGTGTYAFKLQLQAPSQEGSYTLGIKLLAWSKQHQGDVYDTATVTYTVVQAVQTDWAVERVWITPEKPSPDDEVSFHAVIALKQTTSTKPLTVEVACYLDEQLVSPLSLTFQPVPSTQEVPPMYTGTIPSGEHTVAFVVDPRSLHNDPQRQNNVRSYRFLVEPYYAVIHDVKVPREVDAGEVFDIAVGVEYSFPDPTQLRITNIFPVNGTGDEQFDTVTGDGINSYTFSVEAGEMPIEIGIYDSSGEWPTPGPGYVWGEVEGARVCSRDITTFGRNGSAQVEFDRGSGWQHTDPGWIRYYGVPIRGPTYYAVFDSVEATYLGSESERLVEPTVTPMKSELGRYSMTFQIRYLLPVETGLRLTVLGFNGSSEILRVEELITQTESVERIGTYTHEFTFPLMSLREGTYTISFDASVDYMVGSSWCHGDDGSAFATTTIDYPEFRMEDESRTILDDIADRVNDFFRWIRRMFGWGTIPLPSKNESITSIHN